MKIAQNTQKMTIVEFSGSRNELTEGVHYMRNVKTIDTKVNKTPNKMILACGIRKRLTISELKMKIKLHMSVNSALINEKSTITKILNILLLGQKEGLKCRKISIPRK